MIDYRFQSIFVTVVRELLVLGPVAAANCIKVRS